MIYSLIGPFHETSNDGRDVRVNTKYQHIQNALFGKRINKNSNAIKREKKPLEITVIIFIGIFVHCCTDVRQIEQREHNNEDDDD